MYRRVITEPSFDFTYAGFDFTSARVLRPQGETYPLTSNDNRNPINFVI